MGTTPTPQASAAPTPSEAAKMIPGYNPPALPASTSASQEGLEAASPEATKTRWTIMVYIAADAVLANFGVESLKQLNEAAGSAPVPGDTASVVVAAQFSIDAPGGQTIPRYVFDRNSGSNLGRSLKGHLHASPNMTEQEALTSFLDWVYKRDDCQAENYALILWSHGPELFLQPPPGTPTGSSGSLYLTPIELRHALKDGIPPAKAESLKVVGFDACSMSMFEMAYEIRDVAQYMVASQEEVPDLSFPYNTLVQLVRKYGTNAESLLEQSVRSYVRTYQDYISNAITTMQPVTLSALRLKKLDALFSAVRNLASSLLKSLADTDLPEYLINAREKSRDYAGGLYVDLVEFCTYLYQQLYPSIADEEIEALMIASSAENDALKDSNGDRSILNRAISHKKDIRKACLEVIAALQVDAHGTSPGAVLTNCSGDTRSHGVSLYLPYLTDEQASEIVQPMVKGTRDVPAKGFGIALNASASGYLMSQREDLILDTESYYGELSIAANTTWYDFITEFWTRILISQNSRALNLRYSGVQSAINAIRK